MEDLTNLKHGHQYFAINQSRCPPSLLSKAVRRYSIITLLSLAFFSMPIIESRATECLYVSSYHQGYEWNDGIEEGIERTLKNTCSLDKFYMDSKRNPDESFIKSMAIKAKQYIQKTRPDIVIACDDNASKYLIEPYFKGHKIPFVFCGINWTVEDYGYPYSNATGIIEVAPIRPLLKIIKNIAGDVRTGAYLSADVLTEHKDYQRYKTKYSESGVELVGIFVKNKKAWKREFLDAQKFDFIILNNNGGINDWNREELKIFVSSNNNTLTVTNYEWMLPYSTLAMTKIPQEQGEWAAKVAQTILLGEKADEIPIVVNRRWNIFVNQELLDKTRYSLPSNILSKAIRWKN